LVFLHCQRGSNAINLGARIILNKEFIRQIILFGLAGTIGFLVDVFLLYLLRWYLGLYFGRAFSFSVSTILTWAINRTFTYVGRRSTLVLHKEFISYFLLMLIGGLVNYFVYAACIVFSVTAHEFPFIAVAFGCIAGMSINFFTSKYLVFKKVHV